MEKRIQGYDYDYGYDDDDYSGETECKDFCDNTDLDFIADDSKDIYDDECDYEHECGEDSSESDSSGCDNFPKSSIDYGAKVAEGLTEYDIETDPEQKNIIWTTKIYEPLSGLIWSIIHKKFHNCTNEQKEDMFMAAQMGVFMEYKKYDRSMGAPATFFYNRILHYVNKYFATEVLCSTRYYAASYNKIKRAQATLMKHGKDPNDCMLIMSLTKLSITTIQETLEANATVISTGEESVLDKAIENESPEYKLLEAERKEAICSALKKLTKNERNVIYYRFGFGGDASKTHAAIAKILKMTTEKVRILEGDALQKLKHDAKLNALAPHGNVYKREKNKSLSDVSTVFLHLLKAEDFVFD